MELTCCIPTTTLAVFGKLPLLSRLRADLPAATDLRLLVFALRGFARLQTLSLEILYPDSDEDDAESAGLSGSSDEEDCCIWPAPDYVSESALSLLDAKTDEEWDSVDPDEHKAAVHVCLTHGHASKIQSAWSHPANSVAPLTLACLESFRLNLLLDTRHTSILDRLRLPALRRLMLVGPFAATATLVPRCPVLKELRLRAVAGSDGLNRFFRLPQLDVLELHALHLENLQAWMYLLLKRCQGISNLRLSCMQRMVSSFNALSPAVTLWSQLQVPGIKELSVSMALPLRLLTPALILLIRAQPSTCAVAISLPSSPLDRNHFLQQLQLNGVQTQNVRFLKTKSRFGDIEGSHLHFLNICMH